MAADNAIKVKTETRLDYIDIAKGFVIFLCVLGHAVHFGGLTFRFIFLFHMPFFFIISGWCKAIFDKQKTFLTMIKNNTIKLLLPSLIYRVLISIPIVNVK
ncbi:MAG: acyltransferase family protein, partial [Eubacterium sp.]|nr:acyltransferase family protein [Eubacterium sp.]